MSNDERKKFNFNALNDGQQKNTGKSGGFNFNTIGDTTFTGNVVGGKDVSINNGQETVTYQGKEKPISEKRLEWSEELASCFDKIADNFSKEYLRQVVSIIAFPGINENNYQYLPQLKYLLKENPQFMASFFYYIALELLYKNSLSKIFSDSIRVAIFDHPFKETLQVHAKFYLKNTLGRRILEETNDPVGSIDALIEEFNLNFIDKPTTIQDKITMFIRALVERESIGYKQNSFLISMKIDHILEKFNR